MFTTNFVEGNLSDGSIDLDGDRSGARPDMIASNKPAETREVVVQHLKEI